MDDGQKNLANEIIRIKKINEAGQAFVDFLRRSISASSSQSNESTHAACHSHADHLED